MKLFGRFTLHLTLITAGLFLIGCDYEGAMVKIQPGDFKMGSEEGEGASDETPDREITINYGSGNSRKGFWMAAHEVTARQYKNCVDDGGCNYSGPTEDGDGTNDDAFEDRTYDVKDLDDHPINYVSWEDAQDYVTWMNENFEPDPDVDESADYRLCSEAEFEYVSKRGDDFEYSCQGLFASFLGATQCLDSYAWYSANSANETHEVKSQDPLKVTAGAPNTGHIYDLSGNVIEWVEDWYDEDYYEDMPGVNPQGPTSSPDNLRSARGGGFKSSKDDLRTATRFSFDPDERRGDLGFRICSRNDNQGGPFGIEIDIVRFITNERLELEISAKDNSKVVEYILHEDTKFDLPGSQGSSPAPPANAQWIAINEPESSFEDTVVHFFTDTETTGDKVVCIWFRDDSNNVSDRACVEFEYQED